VHREKGTVQFKFAACSHINGISTYISCTDTLASFSILYDS